MKPIRSEQPKTRRAREPWYVGLLITLVASILAAGVTYLLLQPDAPSESRRAAADFRPSFTDLIVLIGTFGSAPFLLGYYVRGLVFPLGCLGLCGFGAFASIKVLTGASGDVGIAALLFVSVAMICLTAAIGVTVGASVGNGVAIIVRRRSIFQQRDSRGIAS